MVIASFESSHFLHNLMPRFNFLLNMHGLAEKALRFNVSSLLYIKPTTTIVWRKLYITLQTNNTGTGKV